MCRSQEICVEMRWKYTKLGLPKSCVEKEIEAAVIRAWITALRGSPVKTGPPESPQRGKKDARDSIRIQSDLTLRLI